MLQPLWESLIQTYDETVLLTIGSWLVAFLSYFAVGIPLLLVDLTHKPTFLVRLRILMKILSNPPSSSSSLTCSLPPSLASAVLIFHRRFFPFVSLTLSFLLVCNKDAAATCTPTLSTQQAVQSACHQLLLRDATLHLCHSPILQDIPDARRTRCKQNISSTVYGDIPAHCCCAIPRGTLTMPYPFCFVKVLVCFCP